jgi:hypothetical protein
MVGDHLFTCAIRPGAAFLHKIQFNIQNSRLKIKAFSHRDTEAQSKFNSGRFLIPVIAFKAVSHKAPGERR